MKSLVTLLLLLLSFPALSQESKPAESSFGRNHYLLSIGYSFPTVLWRGGYGVLPTYRGPGHVPLMLKVDIPVHDAIGITAVFYGAQQFSKASRYDADNLAYDLYASRSTGIGLGAMVSYHFHRLIPVPKLDVYAGAGVSFIREKAFTRIVTLSSFEEVTATRYRAAPMVALGVRYYVLRKVALFAEGGYTGLSFANAGLTIHLPN